MNVTRALQILLLEIGYFLFVLHLGGSPLGADMPAAAAAIVLVAGMIAIPVALRRRAGPRSETIVVSAVAGLLIGSGVLALSMASVNVASDVGSVALGVALVALNRRPRGAEV